MSVLVSSRPHDIGDFTRNFSGRSRYVAAKRGCVRAPARRMEGRVVEGWEVLVRMVLQVRNACGSAAPAECGSPRRIGDATRAFATGRVDGSRGCGASGEGGIRTPERGQPPLSDFQSRPRSE